METVPSWGRWQSPSARLLVACQPATGITPEVQTGRADAAEGAIMIETDDWTYSVPLDGVTWVDSIGAVHTSGRPECLAPGVTRQVKFVAPEVNIGGANLRPVVWVSCQ